MGKNAEASSILFPLLYNDFSISKIISKPIKIVKLNQIDFKIYLLKK